ncbi:MAG: M23 family metallopeptidase [Dehalococcoidia bacterium]|nr:M23 family peptidase [Chloroflexi bacterium CFX7]MCK6565458.1 M23 family metallopeptidase [Dehalococcoidia bacterium]NUQ55127.1 M23 family metallopeptidase [Dehalococcoidia bacterium]RIL03223.1 MAG: hypothetical protein DCC78_04120 [bacterium]
MGGARKALARVPGAAIALFGATAVLGVVALGAGQATSDGVDQPAPGAESQAAADPTAAGAEESTTILDAGDLVLGPADVTAMLEEGAIEVPLPGDLPPDDRRKAAKDGRFALPLKAWTIFTDRYGAPRGRGWIHGGLDLSLETYPASVVYAACQGVVATAAYSSSYGNHVVVDCGEGWSTLYGHLSATLVEARQPVTFDTALGISGSTGFSTGEHLHFEIRWEGAPVNPEDYLDFGIPEDAPLSNGPLWFGEPGARARTTSVPSSGATGAGSADPRAAVEPTATRPPATATPTRPAATPTRPATPTPKPDR